jgi:hypothetical protein
MMSIDLTTIFGTEISVTTLQANSERTYDAFPGANGVTSMHMGRRGATLVISGTMRSPSNQTYDQARAYLVNLCQYIIDTWDGADETDITYRGVTMQSAIMDALPDGFQLIPDQHGRMISWNAALGQGTVRFASRWRTLK